MNRIDKCPECGAPIQTSVKVYLNNVVLVEDGDEWRIESADDESKAIGVENESWYCQNDCDLSRLFGDKFSPQRITLDGGEYKV